MADLIPPKGYTLITTGKIEFGDQMWDTINKRWHRISRKDAPLIDDEVRFFAGVARDLTMSTKL